MNCEHGYPIRYGCLTCLSVGITVNESNRRSYSS